MCVLINIDVSLFFLSLCLLSLAVMPRFTEQVESAVEALSANPSQPVDENEFIDASRLVYDGIRDIRKAVLMIRVSCVVFFNPSCSTNNLNCFFFFNLEFLHFFIWFACAVLLRSLSRAKTVVSECRLFHFRLVYPPP